MDTYHDVPDNIISIEHVRATRTLEGSIMREMARRAERYRESQERLETENRRKRNQAILNALGLGQKKEKK